MKYYLQTANVSWLKTPKDTYWIETDYPYIQPQQEQLRDTPLGVDLSLVDDKDFCFEEVDTIPLVNS